MMGDGEPTIVRWYSTDGSPIPTRVLCYGPRHPARDEHGRVMHDNTHFETEAEAWENGRASVDATVRLDSMDVEQAAARLRGAEDQLIRSLDAHATFTRAMAAWSTEPA